MMTKKVVIDGFYGGIVMASAFVIVSFAAVLVAKWSFYAKYSKSHK